MLRKCARYLVLAIGMMLVTGAHAQTMSEQTYKRLSKIHELIGEEQYAEGLERLDKLVASVRRNAYEHAMVLQTYGFIWAQRGDYGKAASYFQQAIDLGALPAARPSGQWRMRAFFRFSMPLTLVRL